MKIVIPKEITQNESRVALVPRVAQELIQANFKVVMEKDAGMGADYTDADYPQVEWCASSQELYQDADIILKVQPPTEAEVASFKKDAILISFLQPQRYPERVQALKAANITSFAMEYIPRISRAQSMDALSSQASIAVG